MAAVKVVMTILSGVCHILVVAGLIFIFYSSYQFGYGAFSNEGEGNADYRLNMVVQEGDSQEDVANELYTMEMIRYPKQFLFRARFSEYNGKIKPGSYEISPAMGIDDILRRLTQMEDVTE